MLKHSELIINPDGSVYHLGLKPEDVCTNIITVGDPDRIDSILPYFSTVYFDRQIREFRSVKGRYNDKDILVISTGIGTDNIDIVFTELDACVNIDLRSREVKPDLISLNFFRIGTSGTLRSEIPVGSLLISEYAIGLDVLMQYYQYSMLEDEISFQHSLDSFKVDHKLSLPFYNAKGSDTLMQKFADQGFLKGITLTAPGFYGPQGRSLRLNLQNPKLLKIMSEFSHEGTPVTNLEMETAGIYGMSRALGHHAISLNALLANRFTGDFADDPQTVVANLIEKTLSLI